MTEFSLKNFTVVLLIAALVWFSSTELCNARKGKSWRHNGGPFGSMYRKNGKHHGGGQVQVKGSIFNVLDYGAKGDGKSDDTKAFQAAWANACKAGASTIFVPLGYKFLVGPTSFSGSNCYKNLIFQLEGTVIAPTISKAWGSSPDQWLEFENLVGFMIKGKGTLDGRGSVWWTNSIHDSIDNQELALLDNIIMSKELRVSSSMFRTKPNTKPSAVRFFASSDVTITGITIQNSPQFHLTFDNCTKVVVYNINILSPSDSPNTDGIHLINTTNVLIHHTNISCGDDCISIQTGCKNVLVHDVNCGPGHGISIGSLGIDGTTALVSNVTVRNSKIHDTMTGVRIKTWQGATGLVQGVLFSNIQVHEVEIPIMIDQYYCDHSTCKNQTSAVNITNIVYENIRGTYTVQPVNLSCSDSKPCINLQLSDIELKFKPKGHHMSKPFCWQAFGKLRAPISPQINCLHEGHP